ncbi:MAG: aminotransferase class I/II-fold pyridoxal phosphate-dependent enzyme [Candidatus Cloacimonetes bacterium]|nr:aminotransferase class I/II-fold pyridoxal phosphate-dependent enzyme [Candidatus Cloacimonadota bacterium]
MHIFRKDLEHKKPVNVNVPHKEVMMCLNESTLNPFKVLRERFIDNLEKVELNRYYQPVTQELTLQLVEYVGNGLSAKNIFFGNGADEMIYYIFVAVRENHNSFALSLAPSYFDYKSYSGAVSLDIRFLGLNEQFDFDEEEYIRMLSDDNCKLGIICNPNNPTGNLFNPDKIHRIIQNTNKPIMLDETYFEFSGVTLADYISKYPNLLIVRSFSKAFSGAGLRFGYLLSNEYNIEQIRKVQTVFNSSLLIQTMVLTMLESRTVMLKHTVGVVMQRELMYQTMKSMPDVRVFPSSTNFLTFSLGKLSQDFFRYLQDNEIAIRDVGAHPLLKDCLRVTLSSEEQNDLFLKHLKDFMSRT